MLKYYIVDAFTDHPFGGNPAGVVLLDEQEFPNEELMQRIAAELRYSETVFVKQHSSGEFNLRYFTPKGEVDLCGHATIAAFSLLHKKGMAVNHCLCHTRVNDLDHPSPPPQVVSTGLPDIMLPLPSVKILDNLQPNMEAITALTSRLNAVSLHPFALADDGHTAHVRDFAPAWGIPEESATGTANASLTHYLATHGIIAAGDHSFLQGETMGRPSVVATQLSPDGSIRVGGTAAIVAEGRLFV